MERRSHNLLASMLTAMIALVVALCYLTFTAAAPYIMVANVVSHFIMPEGGGMLIPQLKADVQCSAPPGLQCRTLIQNNRLIINVYQESYGRESAQSFEETHEDDTFRRPFSKPDRMSRNLTHDTNLSDEAGQTSRRNSDSDSDDTQERREHTFYGDNEADNTGDDVQEEMHYFSNFDDTTSTRNHNFEKSTEKETEQSSESAYDEDQVDDHGYNMPTEFSTIDYKEFLNEGNTLDNPRNSLEVSGSGNGKEGNNVNEIYSENYEETVY